MGRVARTRRTEYRSGRKALPKRLAFLKGIKFFAIAEHKSEERNKLRVEFLPTPLNALIEQASQAEDLHEDVEALEELLVSLQERLALLQKDLDIAVEQNAALERVNEQLLKNLDKLGSTTASEPKSPTKGYFQVAEERGFKSHGLPLQGGIPGSGKR